MSLSLGQNHSYINKIENGQAKTSFEGLDYICEYLGITVSDFFDTDIQYPIELQELMKEARLRQGLLMLFYSKKRRIATVLRE